VSPGDVNADGIDDLIIGSYRADHGGRTDAGESYIVVRAPRRAIVAFRRQVARDMRPPCDGPHARACLTLGTRYLRIGGRLALISDTRSTPAIAQIGCEKSFARLGTGTSP